MPALTVRNDEAFQLAEQLAQLTGETRAAAVTSALREKLQRELEKGARPGLAERLLEIGRRCAERMEPDATSADHGTLLYDEDGLPK